MTRLVGEDFARLFQTFERTAFRLEVRDHYAVADETQAFRAFLAGERFDLEWHQGWLATIRTITASGRRMHRVRLISEPPSDYQRFELAVTPSNLEAGEDILMLPRSATSGLDLPAYDFWIFDDIRLGIMHFDDEGLFQGAEIVSDPQSVAAHQAARRRSLVRATPYDQYIAAHPTTD